MNDNENMVERYRREMMEMYRRANRGDMKEEKAPTDVGVPDESDETHKNEADSVPEESAETESEEPGTEPEAVPEEEPDEEPDEEPEEEPDIPVCSGNIALCDFSVGNAKDGMPLENAQIMLYRNDGFFVRALTDEEGKTGKIPLFANEPWHLSVTCQGFIPVRRAEIKPTPGRNITVPVRLDESLQLSDVFAGYGDSIVGVQQN